MTDENTSAGQQGGSPPTIEAMIANLNTRVTAIESARATAVASAPTPQPPQPSKGRIVFYRDGAGNESPAMITRVFDNGSVALTVFRDDAVPTGVTASQISPAIEGAPMHGWFWPPRT